MEFRERLYQLRKGRGISQEELANAVGVSRQAVQKWEAGASTPDLNNLSALAGYFSVTLDYLVRGVEPEAPQAAPAERTVIHNYYTPYHYEYRSKCTLLGLPLVHIQMCIRDRPEQVDIVSDTAADFAELLWASLNEDNKVSLFVRYIDRKSGQWESVIKNKHN